MASNSIPVLAYTPQKGDSFNYTETTTVNNGQGSYSGYTDQTITSGMELVNSVNGTNVSSHYNYTYSYSSSQGNSTTGSSFGDFTWSTNSYAYVKGTDNQVGYTTPTYVWFAINPNLGVNQNFTALNTQFVILSKNYSLLLPTEGNRYVQTILAEGTGQFQRNDAYGTFSGPYTWYQYYDPVTGYIVAYNYIEQDSGSYQGQSGSFTYTTNLYVTSTSYTLAAASPSTTTIGFTTTNPSEGVSQTSFFVVLALVLIIVLVVVLVVVYAVRRSRRRPLPLHPYSSTSPPPPPSTPWGSNVDLGSKPSEQVVIRDVAKVACRYCGTLIPTTVDHCPYCGAPTH